MSTQNGHDLRYGYSGSELVRVPNIIELTNQALTHFPLILFLLSISSTPRHRKNAPLKISVVSRSLFFKCLTSFPPAPPSAGLIFDGRSNRKRKSRFRGACSSETLSRSSTPTCHSHLVDSLFSGRISQPQKSCQEDFKTLY